MDWFSRFVPPSAFVSSLSSRPSKLTRLSFRVASSESLPLSPNSTHGLLPPRFDPGDSDDGRKLGTGRVEAGRRDAFGGNRIDADATGGLDEGGAVEDEADESDGGGLSL